MMGFLRKHQKKLFLVITVITIASFSFFGAVTPQAVTEEKPKKIGEKMDGSQIYDKDVKGVVELLQIGGGHLLKTDFIEGGIFSLLAEKYFEQIAPEFKDRLEKAKAASFYSHPQAPFISAIQVWSRYSPQLAKHLREVKAGSCSASTFAAYAKLYVEEQNFPPELLRSILLYEQQNMGSISPDPQLSDSRNLALFGHYTFEDWFGREFSTFLGKFILNTAVIAHEKGYRVSLKEARTDLMEHFYDTMRFKLARKEVPNKDVLDFMRGYIQLIGINENRAVSLWRDVMLVHRFFQDIEQGVLLDPVSYEQFSMFADAKASIELYQLPEELRLKDFESMLKVQYYLEAVSPKGKQSIVDLPRQFYSLEDVEKRCPELVITPYHLEIAKISESDIASKIALKQTWEFEVSDEGWNMLKEQFLDVRKSNADSTQARAEFLDNLKEDLRLKIDQFARSYMAQSNSALIQETLQGQPYQKITVNIPSRGAIAPFDNVEDTGPLLQLLSKAQEGEVISFVTPDKKHYYRMKVLAKPGHRRIMTLKEAMENNWLGTLLDKKLSDALVDARRKDSAIYKKPDGSWRPLHEVRDHVGAYVYSDLLKALSQTPLSYPQYVAKRFEIVMEQAKKSIQEEGEFSKFLCEKQDPLIDQWKLLKMVKEVKRSDDTRFSMQELFTKAIGSWSSVLALQGGDVSFYRLLKREDSERSIATQVQAGQKLIGQDMRKQMIKYILDQMEPS